MDQESVGFRKDVAETSDHRPIASGRACTVYSHEEVGQTCIY
jgi:hypothetical protein